jgi:hypothetical protein
VGQRDEATEALPRETSLGLIFARTAVGDLSVVVTDTGHVDLRWPPRYPDERETVAVFVARISAPSVEIAARLCCRRNVAGGQCVTLEAECVRLLAFSAAIRDCLGIGR